jgi:hypothetical protein
MAARGELPRGNLPGGPFGQRLDTAPGQGQSGGQGSGPGILGPGGPGGIQGSITAVDGGVVTVRTDAGPIKVRLASGTAVRRTAPSSRADLKVGSDVQVRLDLAAGGGADGTVTARSIVVGPLP